MTKKNCGSDRAFSLVELIVIIALIAIVGGAMSIHTLGVVSASNTASDRRNVQTWNEVYTNVVAAEPSFANLSWSDASGNLAAGVTINVGSDKLNFFAPVPQFHHSGDPSFVPGIGITHAPGDNTSP
jgi:hypothetical protein